MHKKIIHVTEAMGGGVLDFLVVLSEHQEQYFESIEVIYIERKETPNLNSLKQRFSKSIILSPVSFPFNTPKSIQKLFRPLLFLWLYAILLSKLLKTRGLVIHAHSTISGLIVRSVPKILLKRNLCAYSPHGYAFLKNDIPKFAIATIKGIERFLSKKGTTICTSNSEVDTATMNNGKRGKIELLTNGVEVREIATSSRTYPTDVPVIGMVGRIVPQKAPWRFQQIAQSMSPNARFIWIGSSDANPNNWLDPELIEISPWVEREILKKEMDRIDVLLFPTQYEGASLAISLAQSRGIPAVVSNVTGNKDSVLDHYSGYICDTNEEMIRRIYDILESKEKYEAFSKSALAFAYDNLSNHELGKRSLKTYFAESV